MRFNEFLRDLPDRIGLWPARAVMWLMVYGLFLIPVTSMLKPQWELKRHGVRTQGRVIALTPENHATVRYRFEVSGVAYQGSWGPPFNVAVGDSLPVTYLPNRPATSIAGEPSLEGWWFLPFVLLPGVATLAAFVGVRSPRRSAA